MLPSPPYPSLDRVLGASRFTLTGPEAAAAAGVDPAWAALLWRAAGFDGRFDEPELSDDDVRLLVAADELMLSGEFSTADVLRFARMFNLAAAPLAETAAAALTRRPPGTVSNRLQDMDDSLAQFEDVLLHTWRRRLVRVLTDERASRSTEEGVAFVDIVDFTDLVRTDPTWLSILDRLETIVFDIVADHGGRVIKTIGDEVMWVHPTAAGTVGSCTAVAAAVRDDPVVPSVRIGAGWGEIIATRGDRFGTPVNLASRLVRRCRPGGVVLSAELAKAAAVSDRSRRRWIKGLGLVDFVTIRPQ